MTDRQHTLEKTCAAVGAAMDEPRPVCSSDRLVTDLGFDSLRMASLSLTIEDEFGETLLLNEWITVAEHPATLTVASLADFVHDCITGNA